MKIIDLARNIYSLINSRYAEKRRQKQFEQMRDSGELEGIVNLAEVEGNLGITKISDWVPEHAH